MINAAIGTQQLLLKLPLLPICGFITELPSRAPPSASDCSRPSVLHHKATAEILYRQRRPKTSLLGQGMIICTRFASSPDEEREQVRGHHFVMKAKMLALTIVATKNRKQRFAFHVGFNPTQLRS